MVCKRIDIVLGNTVNRKELYGIVLQFENEKNHLIPSEVIPGYAPPQEQEQRYVAVKLYNFYSLLKKTDIPKFLRQVKEFEDNVEKYGSCADPSLDDECEPFDEDDVAYDACALNGDIYFEIMYDFGREFKYYTLDGIEIKYYFWPACLKKEREGEGVFGLSLFYIEDGKFNQIHDRKTEIDPLFDGKENKMFSCEDDCYCCT